MQNETLESLFGLLKLAIKKSWANIRFIMLVIAFNTLSLFFLLFIQDQSLLGYIISVIIISFCTTQIFFSAATIAISKDNSVKNNLNLSSNLFATRFLQLLPLLIIKFTTLSAISMICEHIQTESLSINLFAQSIQYILLTYIFARTYVMEFSAIIGNAWPVEAFNTSSKITNGSKWKISLYILATSLLSIIFIMLIVAYIVAISPALLEIFVHLSEQCDGCGIFFPYLMIFISTSIIAMLLQFITIVLLTQSCLLYLKRR